MGLLRLLQTSRNVGTIRAIVGVTFVLLLAQPAMAAASSASAVPPAITVTGNVFDPLTRDRAPIAGARIEFIETHGDRLLAVATSDEQGVYSVSLETGGKPISAYVRASKEGRVTSLIFPPDPLTTDLAPCAAFERTRGCILVALLTPMGADAMARFAGVMRDPAKGEVLSIAADCSSRGVPVEGATVEISPKPEQVVYTHGPFPAPGAEATDSSGRSFGFNIKPGRATIQAHYPDRSTGVAQVLVEAGAITIASTLPQNAHCAR